MSVGVGVAITAVSARTPLGLQAASSAAAVRAGISRVRLHPVFATPSGDHVKGAVDAALDPNLQGLPRLIALASYTLTRICELLPKESREGRLAVPVLISVPEHRPGFTATDESKLVAELQRGVPPGLVVQVPHRGHAGALHAMGLAAQWIASGRSEMVIVGGVESYFDADTIDWLALLRHFFLLIRAPPCSIRESDARTGQEVGAGA